MIVLQGAMVAGSLLLLAAHFLRARALLMVVAVLGLMGLLFVRRPWAARVLQTGLALGAVVWLLTLIVFARARLRSGEPVVRLVIILAGVIVWTLLAARTLQRGGLARWFGLGDSGTKRPSSS